MIELDGETHAHQADYDTARTQEMAAYGYHVIRFENQQIFDDLDSVLNVIYQKALSRSPPK
ncbi:MAG: hypothetical protein Fur0046_25430 [Cyanobacteria bacterium J069]